MEEPLSSFGLTSISVAELGTFIQTEFNHRVSALELMTTASALSLAEGIVHGVDNSKEEEREADQEGRSGPDTGAVARARRAPSAFANAPGDHFPQGTGVPVAARESRQPSLAKPVRSAP